MPGATDKPNIARLVICGDSLSDRGLLYNDPMLGPIVKLGPLGNKKDSPRHRFGNGYIWDDLVICFLAAQSEINDLTRQTNTDQEKYDLFVDMSEAVITQSNTVSVEDPIDTVSKNADRGDAIIDNDENHGYISSDRIIASERFKESHYFYLNNPTAVKLGSQDFVISLAEGGATAYDYGQFNEIKLLSPLTWWRFIYGMFLSNLSKQREQLEAGVKIKPIF